MFTLQIQVTNICTKYDSFIQEENIKKYQRYATVEGIIFRDFSSFNKKKIILTTQIV